MNIKKKQKIAVAVLLGVLVAVPLFITKEKESIKIVPIDCGVKAYQIYLKSNNVLYVKCKFKNAGVLHNSLEKHGISAIVGELACRKINGLSPEETSEKLLELGIQDLSVNSFEDDFVLSFYVLKDKVPEALQFLSDVFVAPEFSENDLEFIKQKYPQVLDPDSSHPQELLFDKLMSLLYENHNYGLSTTGTAKAISGITENDVQEFVKSNFSKNNMEVFFSGDLYLHEMEKLVGILTEKIPQESVVQSIKDISSSGISELPIDRIAKKDMGDIVAVMSGIRLDNLSTVELAALHIILETFFDEKIGVFQKQLQNKKIAYKATCSLLKRSFSNVFYIYCCMDKNALDDYLMHLKDFFQETSANIEQFEQSKNYLIAQSENGFSNMNNIEKGIEYNSLPFSEVTIDILKSMMKKIFDHTRLRTVYISQ